MKVFFRHAVQQRATTGKRSIDMEGIKAIIQSDGVENSVEFSVEEARSQNTGKPWGEMSEADQEAALKDYALALFTRDTGKRGDLRVRLEGGTFSDVREGDV
jgi:hypothetical protein